MAFHLAFWEIIVIGIAAGAAIWVILKLKGIDLAESMRGDDSGGSW